MNINLFNKENTSLQAGGAFQTAREIFFHPIWKNVVEFRLFFLIYGMAVFNPEGEKYGDVKVNRGQWLRSYRKIQKDLEYIENNSVKYYSLATIKRAIQSLEEQEMITTKNTKLGTLFTVVNYDKYQRLENYRQSSLKQQRNSSETPSEQQRNNNNNVNNVEQCKQNNYICDEFVRWFNEQFNKNHRPQSYRKKISARLKTYTVDELKKASLAMKNDSYMMGGNEKNKVYGTLEYITRNDVNVDKWLNAKQNKQGDLFKEPTRKVVR